MLYLFKTANKYKFNIQNPPVTCGQTNFLWFTTYQWSATLWKRIWSRIITFHSRYKLKLKISPPVWPQNAENHFNIWRKYCSSQLLSLLIIKYLRNTSTSQCKICLILNKFNDIKLFLYYTFIIETFRRSSLPFLIQYRFCTPYD